MKKKIYSPKNWTGTGSRGLPVLKTSPQLYAQIYKRTDFKYPFNITPTLMIHKIYPQRVEYTLERPFCYSLQGSFSSLYSIILSSNRILYLFFIDPLRDVPPSSSTFNTPFSILTFFGKHEMSEVLN